MGGVVKEILEDLPEGRSARDIGQALYAAQRGEEYSSVKSLKGFGGRSVREIVAGDAVATYRTVYTVRFLDVILCAACVPEEIEEGHSHAAERH